MGSNHLALHINFFSFKFEETCTFINDFQLEISSKCDIENSSTLCKKIIRGERAFWRMLMSADPFRWTPFGPALCVHLREMSIL